jgi:branched-chain amino acid transport system permease protein
MIGGIYGLLALGYSLIYRASGLMTFVQGDFLMLGAFLGLTFYKFLNLPFWLALILTAVCLFIIGLLTEKFIIRKLLKAKANLIYIVLATIAMSIILQNLVMVIWGSEVFYFPPIFDKTLITIGGYQVVPEAILSLLTALVVMLGLHLFMSKTRYGTSMRAAAQDPIAARTMAINVSRTTGITWGLSAALAGIAGTMIGPIYGASTHMGTMIGLKGFAAAVIGGYGNMYGAIIGSFILGTIETFTAGVVSSLYKDFISFFILILFLIIKPRGILNAEVYDD